jgi:enoyl-CoA hydratase / 3-hydroxyacyl-CoA dehydrogenase
MPMKEFNLSLKNVTQFGKIVKRISYMKKIKVVGVVGAGTMGSGLAQKFAQEGFEVILADRELKFVDNGLSKIKETLHEGVDRRLFSEDQVQDILGRITGTADLKDLMSCDLIIEAIFENFQAKTELFETLGSFVNPNTIIATNTSSFSVSDLSRSVKNPERFIGLHYFFHPAKNRLVEIIPSGVTSADITKSMYRFSISSGKDPIYTADKNGFAVNRFFVPWLNESVRILSEKVASIAQIDAICQKAFGIGMGPFELMNATGIPVAMHAQKTLESFGPFYKVSPLLEKQVASNQMWDVTGVQSVEYSDEMYATVSERMLGCIFFVCSQILAEKVCSATDLNRGAKIGLRWRQGPIDLLKRYGEDSVKDYITQILKPYKEKIPMIAPKDWEMEFVTSTKVKNTITITMSRPEDMNALNEEVVKQLDAKFSKADADPKVDTIYITGLGKAFVAGADIRFFVKNIKAHKINHILDFTKYGQEVFNKIDKSKKHVVAILNGLALGGGLELALCADQILATPKANLAFPETGIGIYPGLGGTQRATQRVGKGIAKYLILTGKMIKAKDALEIGLIDGVINSNEVYDIIEGQQTLPISKPRQVVGRWEKIGNFYAQNNYKSIINNEYIDGGLDSDTVAKLAKTMKFKAPIAMDIAEQLINEANGPESELEHLSAIFNTSDAFLGLTSIGKKVEYEGK